MQIPTEVTESLMALVSTVAVALVAWVTTTVRNNVQNQYTRGSMLRFSEAVETAVRAVGHEFSNELRVVNADGKISPEEARWLRQKAVEYTKQYLGQNGIKELERIVGIEELDGLFQTMIEAQLHKLKEGNQK